ncbi:MAG: hypothetical protein IKY28_01640 [Anaerotignum sp.]|nr:hypothetical protein [Anaerotignum sp.]
MKKLLAIILAGTMLFGLAACNKTEPTTDENTMPENMASMTAPIDALARCMLENGLEYDPEDPDFFWTALYYFTGGYGLNHELVTEKEGTYQLQIPTPVMQEHATALFADYTGLFDLPSIMKGNISYDSGWDAYSVSRGDIGLSQMQIISYEKTEDGHLLRTHLLSADSEEELIQAYDVTLVDNASVDGIENPLYFYSVKDIVPVAAETQPDSEATVETAIFNGLADSHTAELTLTDGSVQPFQFDPNSDIAKVIGSLVEGDGVTIGYVEQINGSLMLISVE